MSKIEFTTNNVSRLKPKNSNYYAAFIGFDMEGFAVLVYPSAGYGSSEEKSSKKGKFFVYRYREHCPIKDKSKLTNKRFGSYEIMGIKEAKQTFLKLKKEHEDRKLYGKLSNDSRKDMAIYELLSKSYIKKVERDLLNLLFKRMYGDYEAIYDIHEKLLDEKHQDDIARDSRKITAKNPRSPDEHKNIIKGYGLSENTVARSMKSLKGFMKIAEDEKIIESSPFNMKIAKNRINITMSENNNITERLHLNDDESIAFLRYLIKSQKNWQEYLDSNLPFDDVDEPYVRLIALICFETGARIGEVRQLNYNQFEFDEYRIKRNKKAAKDLGSKKKSKKDDYIYISDIVIAGVKDYWNKNYSGRNICVNKENGQLFWNHKHNKSISGLRKTWARFLKRAGIEHIGFHSLRRALGKDLYSLTKDSLIVRDQLNHSNVETTTNYYINLQNTAINRDINDLSEHRLKMIDTK
jgi:integrase